MGFSRSNGARFSRAEILLPGGFLPLDELRTLESSPGGAGHPRRAGRANRDPEEEELQAREILEALPVKNLGILGAPEKKKEPVGGWGGEDRFFRAVK